MNCHTAAVFKYFSYSKRIYICKYKYWYTSISVFWTCTSLSIPVHNSYMIGCVKAGGRRGRGWVVAGGYGGVNGWVGGCV